MATRIRGIRQGIPGGFLLGRAAGPRGQVTLIPIAPGGGATATATAGGFTPQAQTTGGGVALNPTGAWSNSTAYNPGDVVTYNGGAYLNFVAVSGPGPNTSPDLDDAHWLSQGVVNTVDSNFTISAGQLQLHTIASGNVLGNSTGGTAEPTAATMTAMIDQAFGSTEGQILQRGASAWQILAPGSANQVLASGGAAALNTWAGLSSLLDSVFGSTEGQILQRGASAWQILAPGSANQSLLSGGAGALNKWGPPVLTSVTNSLGADVVLNNVSNYFVGPSVAQGTSGTWLATGTVTLVDTAGAVDFLVRLWDGTTVIASCVASSSSASLPAVAALSGVLASPAANIRIEARDISSISGKIVFNTSGNSKDSTLTAIRIG